MPSRVSFGHYRNVDPGEADAIPRRRSMASPSHVAHGLRANRSAVAGNHGGRGWGLERGTHGYGCVGRLRREQPIHAPVTASKNKFSAICRYRL